MAKLLGQLDIFLTSPPSPSSSRVMVAVPLSRATSLPIPSHRLFSLGPYDQTHSACSPPPQLAYEPCARARTLRTRASTIAGVMGAASCCSPMWSRMNERIGAVDGSLPHRNHRAGGRGARLPHPRVRPQLEALPQAVHLGEKGVRLAQKLQVGPCIPVGTQLEKAEVGPASGPTWRLSHCGRAISMQPCAFLSKLAKEIHRVVHE